MPKIFALRAVQRHTAASRSTKPPSREQQELVGGLPSVTFWIKPSTSAQTPNFSASLGHVVELGGGGGDGVVQLPDGGGGGARLLFGGGGGARLLFGGGGEVPGQAAFAMTKQMRLAMRKIAALDAMV
jgi:hypothetical protein